MDEIREKLDDLEDRYYRFTHQQRCFADALTAGRRGFIIPAPIKTVTEVLALLEGEDLERSKDVRIVEVFASIFSDIDALRKQFKHLLIGCLETNDKIKTSQAAKKLVQCLKKWRTMMEPDFDFSELRAKYPHSVVERLSSVEARELYAGVVSFLPIALDNVRIAFIYLQRVFKQTTAQIPFGFSDQWSSRSSTTSLSRALASTRPNSAFINTIRDENNNEKCQIEGKSRPQTAHSSLKLDIPKTASNPTRSNSLATNDLARLDTPAVRSPSAASALSRRSSGHPKSRVSSSHSNRPKTSSSADWIDIENVDEGLTHGDVEVNPRYSKSSSRNSATRRSAPLSRTPLSTIRQRLKANPREVSAIQEKLRQMRSQSATSTPGRIQALDGSSQNGKSSENGYKQVPTATPIANGSARLDPISSQASYNLGRHSKNDASPTSKFTIEVYESSKGKPDISPFPVSGTKKEIVESPRKTSATKRRQASSSARMSQLLGRENRIDSRASEFGQSWRGESEKSFVASLNKFSSNGKDRDVASSSINQSAKLTIPHTRGTDRLWQP